MTLKANLTAAEMSRLPPLTEPDVQAGVIYVRTDGPRPGEVQWLPNGVPAQHLPRTLAHVQAADGDRRVVRYADGRLGDPCVAIASPLGNGASTPAPIGWLPSPAPAPAAQRPAWNGWGLPPDVKPTRKAGHCLRHDKLCCDRCDPYEGMSSAEIRRLVGTGP